MTVSETLEQIDLSGQLVTGHGFAAGDRDYEIIVEMAGPSPTDDGAVQLATATLIFTHCVEVHYRASPAAIQHDDAGLNGAEAERGLVLHEGSATASQWSSTLGHPMHEAELRTSAYTLRLVFANVELSNIPSESLWLGGTQS